MMLRLRSLRQKLLGVVMLATLAALLIALGLLIAYDLRIYHRNLLADMNTQSELIGHMSAPAARTATERVRRARAIVA